MLVKRHLTGEFEKKFKGELWTLCDGSIVLTNIISV